MRILKVDILKFNGFSDSKSDILKPRWLPTAVLHAGAIFLVDVDAGRDVQRLAFAAALDEIDANADLVNLELLVEPEGSGFRARRLRLP